MELNQKKYQEYVKQITPVPSLGAAVCKAALTGGVICTVGQLILNGCKYFFSLDQETAGTWTSVILIFLGILLTVLNVYSPLVRFGGAGALVPITGFANSVAAPAVEFHPEGEVFGVGCKIFTIAGPVILYGVLSSWILGLISILWQSLGRA